MHSSASQPIHYYHRYNQKLQTEHVYGDHFLKWAYATFLGNLTTEFIVKRALFSKWFGWRMSKTSSRERIVPFIERFDLDPNDFLEPVESYKTFNEFFYRKLKAEVRPIDNQPQSVIFPADGRHLGFSDISAVEKIFVKGQYFDLRSLLGDSGLAERYTNGALVLSRLCPVDYHRFHFPADGHYTAAHPSPRCIQGSLYSVNPIALRKNIGILWENKRYISVIETDNLGKVVMIEVGATCVGSVKYTHTPAESIRKGAEKGYFRFGGSSVITIFEPGRVTLANDLLEYSNQGIELFAKYGDRLGSIIQ